MDKVRSKYNLLISLGFASVMILTACLYWNGLGGIFLLDDNSNIQPTLMSEFDVNQLIQVASSNSSGELKRPISTASFAITSILHGITPWGFKYHNLLIHLLIGVLVFVFSRQLFEITQKNKPSGNTALYALVCTAIWLVHPLNVSTVLYAVQRMTQLSTLFVIASLVTCIYGFKSSSSLKKVLILFLAYPCLLVLGLLSKENAAVSAFLVLLMYAFYHFHAGKNNNLNRSFAIVFGVLPLLLGAIVLTLKAGTLLDYSTRDFTLLGRLVSQVDFLSLYIKQLAVPRLSSMGLYFDDYVIPTSLGITWALSFLFIFLLLCIGSILSVRGSLTGIGILFFFLSHTLESSIIPLELAFEHRNYLPSIGIIIALVYFISRLNVNPRIRSFIFLIWFLCLATLLNLRVDFWSDAQSWQQTTLAFRPLSERTRIEYIFSLENAGESALALEEIEKSIEILPSKLSFKFLYFAATCLGSQESDNIDIIDQIYRHLNTNNLTTTSFNTLALLLDVIVEHSCSSIDIRQISNIIDTAAFEQEKRSTVSRTYGYLKILQAKIMLFRGELEKSSDLFMEAYEITGEEKEIFSAMSVLLLDDRTRAKGFSLFEDIKNDKYFNSNLFAHKIEEIERQLENDEFFISIDTR